MHTIEEGQTPSTSLLPYQPCSETKDTDGGLSNCEGTVVIKMELQFVFDGAFRRLLEWMFPSDVNGLNRSETRNAVRREFAIRLFELLPELGGRTGSGTVGEVEDWEGIKLAHQAPGPA